MADFSYINFENVLSQTEEGRQALKEIADLQTRLRDAERSNRQLRSENMRLVAQDVTEASYSDEQRIGLFLKSISLPNSSSIFDEEKVLKYAKSNLRRQWSPALHPPHYRDYFLYMETLKLAYHFVKSQYEV
jgi:hypothetical protein